jgi:hypothetical protein
MLMVSQKLMKFSLMHKRRRSSDEAIEELIVHRMPVPASEISDIEGYLSEKGVFLTHFSDDPKLVYSVSTYLHERALHQTTTRVLIDRQIASFMKQLLLGRPISIADRKLAAAFMCFAKLAHFEIEPNIAVYEYADSNGTARAWQDACVLSHASRIDFPTCHSLFLGASEIIPDAERFNLEKQLPPQTENFQRRLRLFRYCLGFVLRLAILERSSGKPVDKMLQYLQWMYDEYFFGAPGVLFGSLFLSPLRKSNMIKNVGSNDRSRVLAGIRNACWDITLLQQWIEYVKHQVTAGNYMWIICSSDTALLSTARSIFLRQRSPKTQLRAAFQGEWGRISGNEIFRRYCELDRERSKRSRPANRNLSAEYWEDFARKLEAQL